jgi:NAD(P)H-flavin reductase
MENPMTARLVERVLLAPEVGHFVFEVPGPERVTFHPGQFVFVHHGEAGHAVKRAYSIASPPDAGKAFELCVKHVSSGALQNYLFQMRPGEEVRIEGPHGRFLLRQPVRNSLFVAAGTGIAPVRSMIGHALRQGATARLQLLFGSRSEEAILYSREFEQLAAAHANFEFHPTLSSAGAAWAGRRGRVQEHLFPLLAGRTDLDVYVCGARAMVNEVRERLEQSGFDPQSIIYEKY